MTGELYQYGTKSEFFDYPSVSLSEMRSWMKKGAGTDAIGLGAVVGSGREIIGELVMPGNGKAYMIGRDGKPAALGNNARIKFAQVGFMQPEISTDVEISDAKNLQENVERLLQGKQAGSYIVRVKGIIEEPKFQSVSGVGKNLATMDELENKRVNFTPGTGEYELVGVYSKEGDVVSGATFDDKLHLHGIDAAHKMSGGHVSGFGDVSKPHLMHVEIMPIESWLVVTRKKAIGEKRDLWQAKVSKRTPKDIALRILDMPVDGCKSFEDFLASSTSHTSLAKGRDEEAVALLDFLKTVISADKIDVAEKPKEKITQAIQKIGGWMTAASYQCEAAEGTLEAHGAELAEDQTALYEAHRAHFKKQREQFTAIQAQFIDLKEVLGKSTLSM